MDEINIQELLVNALDSHSGIEPPVNLSGKTLQGIKIKLKGQGGHRKDYLKCANFDGATLVDCVFTGIQFKDCQFNKAVLERVTFNGCGIRGGFFIGAEFKETSFKGNSKLIEKEVDFSGATIVESEFIIEVSSDRRIRFERATINNSDIKISKGHVDFTEAKIVKQSTIVVGPDPESTSPSIFADATISKSTLKGSKYINADFENVDFTDSEFSDCTFEKCNFKGATLTGLDVNNDVSFTSPNFLGAKVDRYTLECIPFEQIPNSYRVKMICHDDVAKLRLMYSGVFGVVNFIALVLFVAPYFWFMWKMWAVATFHPLAPNETISMGGALLRYIVNGGKEWMVGYNPAWGPLLLFIMLLLYNVSRFALLLKTISLEHKEKITKQPVPFTLDRFWFWLYKGNIVLFVFSILFAALHTWHFLSQRVPIGAILS